VNVMPASRADRILVRAETLVATPGSYPSVQVKNEEAPSGASSRIWATG